MDSDMKWKVESIQIRRKPLLQDTKKFLLFLTIK